MANHHSTGKDCPSQVTYAIPEPTYYVVNEPVRPSYGAPVPITLKRLAYNTRRLRQARGWSQEVLGEHASLDRTFIGAIERMERNVSLTTVEKIAKALDVTPSLLLAENSD